MASSGASQSWIDFLPLLAFALVAVMIMLAGRAKMLRCPECGNIFAAPALDNKSSGSGSTLPYLGKVKCPKCGQSRGRRGFKTVKVKQPTFNGVLPQPDSPSS